MPSALYLHGFASSPRTSKGTFLASRFAELGIEVVLPALEEGVFEKLTITRQLQIIARAAARVRPRIVIGSSLGGYLAALHAAREPNTTPALVLLAPAFDFAQRLSRWLGPQMEAWQRNGTHTFHHYGLGREAPLAYRFFEDALLYEPFPEVTVPTKILHGRFDDIVDPALSVEFAHVRPHVEVEWLDSDHQLLNVSDEIWHSIRAFYDRV